MRKPANAEQPCPSVRQTPSKAPSDAPTLLGARGGLVAKNVPRDRGLGSPKDHDPHHRPVEERYERGGREGVGKIVSVCAVRAIRHAGHEVEERRRHDERGRGADRSAPLPHYGPHSSAGHNPSYTARPDRQVARITGGGHTRRVIV
jgi:hypothetical protein